MDVGYIQAKYNHCQLSQVILELPLLFPALFHSVFTVILGDFLHLGFQDNILKSVHLFYGPSPDSHFSYSMGGGGHPGHNDQFPGLETQVLREEVVSEDENKAVDNREVPKEEGIHEVPVTECCEGILPVQL